MNHVVLSRNKKKKSLLSCLTNQTPRIRIRARAAKRAILFRNSSTTQIPKKRPQPRSQKEKVAKAIKKIRSKRETITSMKSNLGQVQSRTMT